MFPIVRQRLLYLFYREVKSSNCLLKTTSRCICNNFATQQNINFLNSRQSILSQTRFKTKKSKLQQQSESEEESDDYEDEIIDKNSKVLNIKVTSLRLDSILKSGLGIARNKIEVMFYESKIRINSEKVLKKSLPVQIGDEIDIIKGVNVNNPKFLTVGRVEILNATAKDDHISLKIRRCKSLTIDNYEDKWKPSGSNS